MKRILIIVAILALLSIAIVSLASAATTYVLGPSHIAQIQSSAQSGAASNTLVNLSRALYGHADEASHVYAASHANGDCPFHSNTSASTDSNPSY